MSYVLFDIETVANDRADEYYAARVYRPSKKLADPNKIPTTIAKIKDPELKARRIAEYKAEQQEKIDKSVSQREFKDRRQAALHWWTGKVCCISYWDLASHKGSRLVDVDELSLLCNFFTILDQDYPNRGLIGKSAYDYDIPFLVGRALAHNIGLVPHLRLVKGRLQDIDHMFSRSKQCAQVSTLDNYAWGLGIDGKLAKGSDVQGMYDNALLNGPQWLDKIGDYCDQDVAITVEMMTRYEKVFHNEEALEVEIPF